MSSGRRSNRRIAVMGRIGDEIAVIMRACQQPPFPSHPCTMPAPSRICAARVAREMTRVFGEGHWSPCPSKAEVVRQLRASQVLIASRGEEIIGTVRLARVLPGVIDSESFTKVDTALYVLGLAVSPDARRQGVGRDLIEAAKESARIVACGCVVAGCIRSRRGRRCVLPGVRIPCGGSQFERGNTAHLLRVAPGQRQLTQRTEE